MSLPSELQPQGAPKPVVKEGDFPFAAGHLDHPHIYGQCEGLVQAGGTLKYVYDPDPAKIATFTQKFPDAQVLDSEEALLEKSDIKLIAGAAIPNERGPFGLRVMDSGKDYFTDKAPFTTLEQLESARKKVAETGKKYMVYYSERLHVESAIHAGNLIKAGAIGRVIQVLGLGPHRVGLNPRPDWFYQKEKYGGILCDIGSHQIEQYLYYGSVKDAEVLSARVENFNHGNHPELEDFGEANLQGDNGCANYFRVDWFTPDGLGTWGDGRTLILGTDGYIELRKYIDVGREKSGNHLYLVNGKDEYHMDLNGKVGYPFFGELILDCLNRTENAMTQDHAFKAAELCLKAQEYADAKRA
ncbi:MAG: Gfo/Idh/MocA family oxidoreductase [Trueperaceae bacterium]|nr:Gfo/Idh/MocA family oxidoreductase [Trueperaceae bacterium]